MFKKMGMIAVLLLCAFILTSCGNNEQTSTSLESASQDTMIPKRVKDDIHDGAMKVVQVDLMEDYVKSCLDGHDLEVFSETIKMRPREDTYHYSEKKPKVVYLTSEDLYIPKDDIANDIISEAGCKYPGSSFHFVKDDYANNIQEVMNFSPNIILVTNEKMKEFVYSDKSLRISNAAINDRVLIIPEEFKFEGPSSILGVFWLEYKAYPSEESKYIFDQSVKKIQPLLNKI